MDPDLYKMKVSNLPEYAPYANKPILAGNPHTQQVYENQQNLMKAVAMNNDMYYNVNHNPYMNQHNTPFANHYYNPYNREQSVEYYANIVNPLPVAAELLTQQQQQARMMSVGYSPPPPPAPIQSKKEKKKCVIL